MEYQIKHTCKLCKNQINAGEPKTDLEIKNNIQAIVLNCLNSFCNKCNTDTLKLDVEGFNSWGDFKELVLTNCTE